MDLDDALAELVAHSGDRLLRVAYQLTHDRAAAQDLVQDALLRVCRSMRRRGLPPEDWYAYLRRAVINEYLRARRLRSSGEVVTDRMPEQPVAGSPEDQIADRAQLWTALGALSARQRAALVLRYYEDLPDQQIAALLGCREASVRSLASRGLAVLRQLAVPAGHRRGRSAVSGIEDILRQVMASHDQEAPAAPDLLRGLNATPGPPRRRGKWPGLLVPLAAAAATAAVVAASLAISATFDGHARPGWPRPGRAVPPLPGRAASRPGGAAPGAPLLRRADPDRPRPGDGRRGRGGALDSHRARARHGHPAPALPDLHLGERRRRRPHLRPGRPAVLAHRLWRCRPPCGAAGQHHPHGVLQAGLPPGHPHGQTGPPRRPGNDPLRPARRDDRVPDGTRLGLDLRRSIQSIQVVTLATGAIRSWARQVGGWIGNNKPTGQIFSWTADGTTLEFQQWQDGGAAQILLLDTTAPGTSLAPSKTVLTFPDGGASASTPSSPPTAPGSSPPRPRGSPSSSFAPDSPSCPATRSRPPARPGRRCCGQARAARRCCGQARAVRRSSSTTPAAKREDTALATSSASSPRTRSPLIPHGADESIRSAW